MYHKEKRKRRERRVSLRFLDSIRQLSSLGQSPAVLSDQPDLVPADFAIGSQILCSLFFFA
jgi:hypothetical protein